MILTFGFQTPRCIILSWFIKIQIVHVRMPSGKTIKIQPFLSGKSPQNWLLPIPDLHILLVPLLLNWVD